jgi:hypothetical protein
LRTSKPFRSILQTPRSAGLRLFLVKDWGFFIHLHEKCTFPNMHVWKLFKLYDRSPPEKDKKHFLSVTFRLMSFRVNTLAEDGFW